jgi:hypothetical protein
LVVEQETLHGRVVDEEKVTLAAQLADRKPIALVEVAPRASRGS